MTPLKTFSARFNGTRCELCDEQIYEEDICVYLDDPDAGSICHALCAESSGQDVQW